MESKWCEYKKILDVIDKYYPKECAFTERTYQNSIEFKNYKKVIDNLILREEKDEKYYDLISSVFSEYYVKRWTNATYPSFQYSILLHKNQPILDDDIELMRKLNGKRLNLEIFISRISNYYYMYTSKDMFCNNNDKKWKFYSYDETYVLEKKYIDYFDKEMKKMGMIKLNREMVHIKVPFIETELLPIPNHDVEIFNCLFSDMVIDYY